MDSSVVCVTNQTSSLEDAVILHKFLISEETHPSFFIFRHCMFLYRSNIITRVCKVIFTVMFSNKAVVSIFDFMKQKLNSLQMNVQHRNRGRQNIISIRKFHYVASNGHYTAAVRSFARPKINFMQRCKLSCLSLPQNEIHSFRQDLNSISLGTLAVL